MKDDRKSTIYDIAKEANASPSTVSAVLNGTWKKRRIGANTAERVHRIAQRMGYTTNIQARALRTTKSGLVGMIMPQHDNSFFSALSQEFSKEARLRKLMPAIISTRRDPEQEMDSIANLAAYSADALMIVGASAPNELHEFCRSNGLPHVFVDQPCDKAPSVVSDNADGIRKLTRIILERAGMDAPNEIVFLGGDRSLYATRTRIKGFVAALAEIGFDARSDQIIACGYQRSDARDMLSDLFYRLGRLPNALLVNSMDCFEGTLEFLNGMPEKIVASCQFGVWDHDPVGELCRFPVPMMRQRAEGLIRRAFAHLDSGDTSPSLTKVSPELVMPRNG